MKTEPQPAPTNMQIVDVLQHLQQTLEPPHSGAAAALLQHFRQKMHDGFVAELVRETPIQAAYKNLCKEVSIARPLGNAATHEIREKVEAFRRQFPDDIGESDMTHKDSGGMAWDESWCVSLQRLPNGKYVAEFQSR